MKIEEMLDNLDMKFDGQLHSGFDDTKNIARILMQLKKDGATPVCRGARKPGKIALAFCEFQYRGDPRFRATWLPGNEQVDLTATDFYSPIVVAKRHQKSFSHVRPKSPLEIKRPPENVKSRK